MHCVRSPLTVLGALLFALAFQKSCATQELETGSYVERLDVEMDLHTLNLVQGREERVPCEINRNALDLVGSTVEFVHIPWSATDDYEPIVLTHNCILLGGDPEFYDIEVTTGHDLTTYTLVFKNPRPQDQGHLRCRFVPARSIAPPRLASMSSSRYVQVYDPQK